MANRPGGPSNRAPVAIRKRVTIMKFAIHRPGLPVAILALAGATAFLGYNLAPSVPAGAASASHVSIADPDHPGQLARVSSSGALSTTTSGVVTTVPGTPATPLNLYADGVSTGPFTELVEPTSAHIDLTSLTVAVQQAENEGGHIRVFLLRRQAPAGTKAGSCVADATSDSEIQAFDLDSGTTATLTPGTPIVMAPPSGKDECIAFGADPDTGSSTGQVQVSATGFVASGTYSGPHGTGTGGPRLSRLK
jgi:hypothetical protein